MKRIYDAFPDRIWCITSETLGLDIIERHSLERTITVHTRIKRQLARIGLEQTEVHPMSGRCKRRPFGEHYRTITQDDVLETWQQQLAHYLAPSPTPSFERICRVLMQAVVDQWSCDCADHDPMRSVWTGEWPMDVGQFDWSSAPYLPEALEELWEMIQRGDTIPDEINVEVEDGVDAFAWRTEALLDTAKGIDERLSEGQCEFFNLPLGSTYADAVYQIQQLSNRNRSPNAADDAGWKPVELSDLPPSVIEEAKAVVLRKALANKEFPCLSCGSTNCEGGVFPDNNGFQCWCLDCGEPFYGEASSFNFTDVRVKEDGQ